MRTILVAFSIMLAGCTILDSTDCGKLSDSQLCLDGVKYEIIEDNRGSKLYRSVSEFDTQYIENFVLHHTDAEYYYLDRDLKFEYRVLIGDNYLSLSDVDITTLLDFRVLGIVSSETPLCEFVNIELECINGFYLYKTWGDVKLFKKQAIVLTTMENYLLYETENSSLYMDVWYNQNFRVYREGNRLSFTELYDLYGEEILEDFDINTFWE